MDSKCDPYLRICLSQINCEQFIHIFVENEIDFECFKTLSEREVAGLLVGKLGPQKRVLKEISRIRLLDHNFSSAKLPIEEVETHIQNIQPVILENHQMPAIVANEEKLRPLISTETQAAEPDGMTGTGIKIVDKSIMDKYGFVLPAVGAFATFAVGTVKKMICDQIVHPKFLQRPETVPEANLKSTTGDLVAPMQSSATNAIDANVNDSAKNDFLDKYGNPNTNESAEYNTLELNMNSGTFENNDLYYNSPAYAVQADATLEELPMFELSVSLGDI